MFLNPENLLGANKSQVGEIRISIHGNGSNQVRNYSQATRLVSVQGRVARWLSPKYWTLALPVSVGTLAVPVSVA